MSVIDEEIQAPEKITRQRHRFDTAERAARGIMAGRYARRIDHNPELPDGPNTVADVGGKYPWLFYWQIKTLSEAGLTQSQIAEQLSVSRSAIQRVVRRSRDEERVAPSAAHRREITTLYDEALEQVLWCVEPDRAAQAVVRDWFEKMRNTRGIRWWRQASQQSLRWFLGEIIEDAEQA